MMNPMTSNDIRNCSHDMIISPRPSALSPTVTHLVQRTDATDPFPFLSFGYQTRTIRLQLQAASALSLAGHDWHCTAPSLPVLESRVSILRLPRHQCVYAHRYPTKSAARLGHLGIRCACCLHRTSKAVPRAHSSFLEEDITVYRGRRSDGCSRSKIRSNTVPHTMLATSERSVLRWPVSVSMDVAAIQRCFSRLFVWAGAQECAFAWTFLMQHTPTHTVRRKKVRIHNLNIVEPGFAALFGKVQGAETKFWKRAAPRFGYILSSRPAVADVDGERRGCC